jgi:hypothetical protein
MVKCARLISTPSTPDNWGAAATSLSHLWSPCYTGFISHDIVVTRWRGMLAPGTRFYAYMLGNTFAELPAKG